MLSVRRGELHVSIGRSKRIEYTHVLSNVPPQKPFAAVPTTRSWQLRDPRYGIDTYSIYGYGDPPFIETDVPRGGWTCVIIHVTFLKFFLTFP